MSPVTFSLAVLIITLSVTGYILWRRYQSRRLLMQRVTELEALSQVGSALVAAELDIEALCALIAQEAGKVIDNSTFQVGLFENGLYHILYWCINGQQQPTPRTFDISTDEGVVGWIRQSKRPLLVHDFLREMDTLPARPRYISDHPPRSAIFLPLIGGDEAIGVIAAQSTQPNRFHEDDMRRLTILANQAAAVITNAQLFQQERMRAAHLELVGKIARHVNAVSDLDDIFSQVVWRIQETFDFHPITIFTLNANEGTAVIQASTDNQLSQAARPIIIGEGLVGTAVSTQQTILVNDTHTDPLYLADISRIPGTVTTTTRAEISIPLLVEDEVLGVLDVQSQEIGAFATTEKMVLEALAAEVASAIYKAQQLARQQEQAWITTAQLQIARAISSSTDLEEMTTAVARLTAMLTGIEFCGILLWNDEEELYDGAGFYSYNTHSIPAFTEICCGLGDWSALDAIHVGQGKVTTRRIPAWLRPHLTHEDVMLLPMIGAATMIGVMIVESLPPSKGVTIGRYQFGQRREELLVNIAQQTAQAIESAQLRAAQQEEAWVNTALLQVAEAVNRLIDLNEILHTIVRLIPMLVGVESVMILVWDEERQVFTAGPSQGIGQMGRGLVETLEIDRTELPGLAQLVDSPATAVALHTIQAPEWLQTTLGTTHCHALPLHARNRLVGAMLVGVADGSVNGRSFPTRQFNILNGIAQQAATAVVNNHLYREAAERNRLQQELNVAHEIQISLIPPGSPNIPGCTVASYWQGARQVSGDFYDFIPMHDGRWAIIIADVADKGFPAALFMAVSRTIIRTIATNRTRNDPADILMRVNEIINQDTQSDLFVTVFCAIWDPQTHELTFANGGHNPPLLLRAQGQSQLLSGSGMALGILPEITIESKALRLRSGDALIFYTDGVTEAINEDYDEFGLARLEMATANAQNQDAAAILQAITRSINDHAGDTPQYDDITLVVMKRK
ncbi:MAG: SpoIIE family protein phosphatase [Ardenticatenaceae bacterium]|nr:SpoIIE family protein phosphatase [Ardenticatenaceae bacterium]